ncbi:alpha/beta hydrolase [Xanthobacter sp. KR7-65]|uniref:alpha/beta fold hydrolase n=1 Tax=Xanthobacter sp. KR7-65 TaxID=3156612 RepID=UPI0032B60779
MDHRTNPPGALAQVAPVRVETALGPVEVAQAGAGPAVLALHGGMGGYDQGLILAETILPDARAFRVIAPSRPGYLGTPGGGHDDPQAQADLYAALLDRLGIARVVVAAVSAGGPSALAFAARHPARCAGLVLVSACTVRLDVPQRVRRRLPAMRVLSRLPGVPAFLGWMTRRQPMKAARASIADADLCARTLAHPEAGPLMRMLQESIFRDIRRRLPGTQNDVDRLSVLPEQAAGGIAAPVLVIHGTGDRVVPFHHATRLMEVLPCAELMAIDKGEHVALFTHLDAIRARVGGFLARLAVPASA